ncbi:Uncharacterised protein [Mycobacteroides abscessus subsp. abscessus]|nr:Uncharacterised protein [Mycobacteroides abscessus subsp. abscessus]
MVVVTRTNNRVGRSRGKVMCQKRWEADAPSMAPASCSSSGTVCNPARKMIMDVPKLRQVAMMISESKAVRVSPSQLGPSMPTQPSTVFTSPLSGCSRNRQTTATATMEVITGV